MRKQFKHRLTVLAKSRYANLLVFPLLDSPISIGVKLLALLIVFSFSATASAYDSNLPACPTGEGFKNNCIATVKHTGMLITAEVRNNKLNGNGEVIFDDGKRFYGEFYNGDISGFGTMVHPSGAKYVGEWKNNKKHGKGSYHYADGGLFKGSYVNGEKKGWGVRFYITGAKYEGEFAKGKANGKGVYTYPDGTRYEGDHKDGTSNGKGTYFHANGDKYVGDVQDDLRHGKGTHLFSDGHKYVGDFQKGKRHGKGTYYFPDGKRYQGDFKDNEFNGFGTMTFPDGRTQVALWKDSRLHETINPNDMPEASQDKELLQASSGSGFSVSADGYLITNNHVIEGCKNVFLHSKGNKIRATIITQDRKNDIALLKANFEPSAVFPLNLNRPEILQDIYVAGFPFGMNVSSSVKVTRGIISSLTGIGNNVSEIQIDAALQSGNSGGPVLDDMGNVVAVAVSKLDVKYALKNFGSIPENTNFGVKSSVVAAILDTHNVISPPANKKTIAKSRLADNITKGTYYLSCWMTLAQVKNMHSKKVMFSDLK